MPIQEIKDLLEKIIIFEAGFKENTLAKAQNLDEQKLMELKNILLEVSEWQSKVLDKMAKEDPGFIANLVSARQKVEQELMNSYKQKLAEEDRKKMEIILNKMESL